MLRYRIATKLIAPHLSVKTIKAESIFYDCDKQKMVIGKYFDPNDYGFMRHITNAHGFKEAPTYKYVFLHILHEIGHYMTEEKYGSNKEAQAWFKQNARIIRDNTTFRMTSTTTARSGKQPNGRSSGLKHTQRKPNFSMPYFEKI